MSTQPSSPFLQELIARGFFHQCTDLEGLDALLKDNEAVPIYIGFDCTASSLHVGSLMQIMILRMLQKHGHKPIILLGGGTTKVGDPSGKDKARQLLSVDDIEENKRGIHAVLSQFISMGEGATDAIMVDNNDWLEGINYLDFLRDYGAFFSVNRMLSFDSVKLRLEREQNLSFLEFNYMLLQAYDFVHLNQAYQCRVQIGGSDQWGNIVNGIELQHRLQKESLFGLTTPLITTSSGAKMGKTADGAVWLSKEHLSVYDYWQFWRNVDDADVIRFFKFFTEISVEEIEGWEGDASININDLKKKLATEVTALCHNRSEAEQAEQTAKEVFEKGAISDNMPSIELSGSLLKEGIPAYQLFQQSTLAKSGGEARRLIRGRGARINDVVVEDENKLITEQDLDSDSIKLSSGKKKHILIKLVS